MSCWTRWATATTWTTTRAGRSTASGSTSSSAPRWPGRSAAAGAARLVRDFSYGGITPQFWGSVEAVAGPGGVPHLRHALRQGRAQGVGLPVPRRGARAVPRRPHRGGLMDATARPFAGGSGGWPPRAGRAVGRAGAGPGGAGSGPGRRRADHVEIFLASRIGHHTRFAGDRIHQPQTIVECQVMVRAVAGTGSGRVAVSDLGQAAAAVAAGRRAGPPPGRPARRGGPVRRGRPRARPGDRRALARQHRGLGRRARVSAQAGRIMDAARAAGGTAAGVLTAAVTELAVVTSAGQRAHAAATEAGFALTVARRPGLLLRRRPGPGRRPPGRGRAGRAGRRPGRRAPGPRCRCRTACTTWCSAAWPPAS